MTRLSPELATAIEQARSVSDPTPDNHERVRAALLARLGATEFHAPAPPPAAVGAPILLGIRRHWAWVGGIVCAMGLGALFIASLPDSTPPPGADTRDLSQMLPSPNSAGPDGTNAAAARAAGSSSAPRLEADPPAPIGAEAPRRVIAEPPAPVKVKAVPSARRDIADELPILLRAHAALDVGDGEAALAALNEHARRFPNGILSEERAAERVVALCTAGHYAEGRAERERFLREHPRSTGVARVRGACP